MQARPLSTSMVRGHSDESIGGPLSSDLEEGKYVCYSLRACIVFEEGNASLSLHPGVRAPSTLGLYSN